MISTMSDPSGARDVLLATAADHATAVDADTGMVWVLRYDEVSRIVNDQRTVGVGLQMFDLMGIGDGPLRRWYSSLMFTNEGAAHIRLRRLVNRAFTPRSTAELRSYAAALVAETLDGVEQNGDGDLIGAFSRVPTGIMCRLLGVPDEDVGIFGDWLDDLSRTFGYMDADQLVAASTAIVQLLDYVGGVVERRRSDPAPDLITALLEAEEQGDRLTHDELVTMVANLLVGGHDTTSSQVGCTILTLLSRPEALERIRKQPGIASAAVMETMRFEPSIPAMPRSLAEPMMIGGQERALGTIVLLSVLAANRDPRVWDRPDDFLIDRFVAPETPKLLSFGMGPHVCLGAHLARMTLEETVLGLASRNFEMVTDLQDVAWRVVLGRSPAVLQVSAN
jgi:hypothetical protein